MSKPPTTDTDDALNPKFNAAALDFLLIELVPLAQRITDQVNAREKALMEEYRRSRIFSQDVRRTSLDARHREGTTVSMKDGSAKGSTAQPASENVTCLGFPAVDEEAREGVFWRLDGLGYRVGQGLVER